MREVETGGKLKTAEHNKGERTGNQTTHNEWETSSLIFNASV